MNGWNTRAIVDLLNDGNIPAPGKFTENRTGKIQKTRVVADEEWLWNTNMVRCILRNFAYTGSMVHGKTKVLTVGSTRARRTGKNEQYILKNSHEGIVTAEEWMLAQNAIRSVQQCKPKIGSGYVLLGKVRCGNCGLAMEYSPNGSPAVFCGHHAVVGKASKCCSLRHDAKRIESIAAGELFRRIKLLEYLGRKIEERQKNSPEYIDIQFLRKQTDSGLDALRAEKIRLYEAYADGFIERDEYIRKKDDVAYKIELLTEKLRKAEAAAAEENRLLGEIKAASGQLDAAMVGKKRDKALTREMVLAMVDSVIVHDERNIEVRLSFDDLGKQALEVLEGI